MRFDVPAWVLEIVRALKAAGGKAFVVGGPVRDLLLGRVVSDWDIATDLVPDCVVALFPKVVPTGLKHGTVTIVGDAGKAEVTTFRREGPYADGRHPDAVEFVRDIEIDLARRDFTVNAIAYDPESDELRDPYDGQSDITARLIRAVGAARDRFREDGLRPMRAVRFAATLGFEIEAATLAAIPEAIETTRKVAVERIRDELLKMLGASRMARWIEVMRKSGLLAVALPELLAARGIAGKPHHAGDLYDQRVAICEAIPGPARLRLVALVLDSPGAAFIRLAMSGADRRFAETLVQHHDSLHLGDLTDGAIRRIIASVSRANVEALLAMRRADFTTRADGPVLVSAFDTLATRVRRLAAEAWPDRPSGLALRGDDLIASLGLYSGPEVGVILRALHAAVLDDPALNTRDALLAIVRREFFPKNSEK
ncbi:MAG: [cytidine(C)-cytidine(C)-adenosine (A)]-adding enzyme [Deltaproteobacteria bacterium]|nr:[cytidine(C)-cytidine(C)-adenosine (A)]-adding enzyme [Deltaproteobacteria bacterium]